MNCIYCNVRKAVAVCTCKECWLDFGEPERRMARAVDDARRLAEEWRDHGEFLALKYNDKCLNPPPDKLPWEEEK